MRQGRADRAAATLDEDERLAALYEAVPCGIIVRDAGGRIVFVNSAAKRILRSDPEPGGDRLWMPSLARAREDGSALALSETPGAIAARTGEPVRGFAMRVTRVDGTDCWLLVDAVPLKDGAGDVTRVVTSLMDISERKELEAELQHRALHDQLTGLPNRWLFIDRVTQSISLAKREERPGPALLFADLDGFKALNDRSGHPAGDAMLCEAARRFRSALRDSDTVARIGGTSSGCCFRSWIGWTRCGRSSESSPWRSTRRGRSRDARSASARAWAARSLLGTARTPRNSSRPRMRECTR